MKVNGRFRIAAGWLALAAVLAGCGGGGNSGSTTRNLPPAVQAALRSAGLPSAALVNANNDFGLRLLSQMRRNDAGKNVFVSPVSLALCMEIVYNGAGGSTQQAMSQALGLNAFSIADMNNGNANLQASLVSSDPDVQLTIANSFWYYPANHQILPAFVDMNTQFYGSHIGDLSGAPDNINAWVSDQTNGKITQIVGQDVRNSAGAIVNAVYFKGAWSNKFDTSSTSSAVFTLAGGGASACSMMHQAAQFPYFKGADFQALKMPYGKGRTSMLILLPDAGVSADTVIGEMSATNLAAWQTQFAVQAGSVSLPKFTSTYTVDLKSVLSSLGMGVAFDPNQADFSGMGPGLYLDSALHKSYLSVDESGTVAAGVTAGIIGVTSIPTTTFTMTMDHPFVCAIMDDTTGALLFVGVIDKP